MKCSDPHDFAEIVPSGSRSYLSETLEVYKKICCDSGVGRGRFKVPSEADPAKRDAGVPANAVAGEVVDTPVGEG